MSNENKKDGTNKFMIQAIDIYSKYINDAKTAGKEIETLEKEYEEYGFTADELTRLEITAILNVFDSLHFNGNRYV